VTGNTYPVEGRETDSRHPREHSAIGVSPEREQRWNAHCSLESLRASSPRRLPAVQSLETRRR
jgi:hypothetical protein